MFNKIIPISFVLAIMVVNTAWAAPGPHHGPGPRPHHATPNNHKHNPNAKVNRPWEAKADKNNDGIVNPNEAHHWNKSHSGPVDTKLENKIDANDDGKIQKVELKQGKAHVNTPKEEKMDVNDDGTVQKIEAKQFYN